MSEYYENQNRFAQACSFSGNASINTNAPSSISSANAAASACLSNPSATFTPTAPSGSGSAATGTASGSAGTGSSSNTQNNGASPLFTAQGMMGMAVACAFTIAGMLTLA